MTYDYKSHSGVWSDLTYSLEDLFAINERIAILGTDSECERRFLMEDLGKEDDAAPPIGIQRVNRDSVITRRGLTGEAGAKRQMTSVR
jgi:hypothetical protein